MSILTSVREYVATKLATYKDTKANSAVRQELAAIQDLLRSTNETPIKQEWFSVKDKLPEPYCNVLVYRKSKLNGVLTDFISIGHLPNSNRWCHDDYFGFHTYTVKEDFFEYELVNVSHWQYLPSPP